MARLEMIKSINEIHRRLLKETCEINSVAALLKAGATVKGRELLATMIGVPHALVLEWIHQADLTRVKGIGKEYLALLNALEIKTLKQLKQQTAESLCEKMQEINRNHDLVRRLPTLEMISDWVEQANEIFPTVQE